MLARNGAVLVSQPDYHADLAAGKQTHPKQPSVALSWMLTDQRQIHSFYMFQLFSVGIYPCSIINWGLILPLDTLPPRSVDDSTKARSFSHPDLSPVKAASRTGPRLCRALSSMFFSFSFSRLQLQVHHTTGPMIAQLKRAVFALYVPPLLFVLGPKMSPLLLLFFTDLASVFTRIFLLTLTNNNYFK